MSSFLVGGDKRVVSRGTTATGISIATAGADLIVSGFDLSLPFGEVFIEKVGFVGNGRGVARS